MKQISIFLICLIVGGTFGVFVGLGELNHLNKNQRDSSASTMLIVGLVIGGVMGLVIANSIGKDLENEKQYGFNSIQLYSKQVGRKWVYQSVWTNPSTGNQNKITTCYYEEDRSVKSFLNNDSLVNHNSTSGSNVNIQKNHILGLQIIKSKIISGEATIL